MVNIPMFAGFFTSQVVQDFFHRQYGVTCRASQRVYQSFTTVVCSGRIKFQSKASQNDWWDWNYPQEKNIFKKTLLKENNQPISTNKLHPPILNIRRGLFNAKNLQYNYTVSTLASTYNSCSFEPTAWNHDNLSQGTHTHVKFTCICNLVNRTSNCGYNNENCYQGVAQFTP